MFFPQKKLTMKNTLIVNLYAPIKPQILKVMVGGREGWFE